MAEIIDKVLFPEDPDTYEAAKIIERLFVTIYGETPPLKEWHRSPSVRGAKTYHGKLTHALEHLVRTGSIGYTEFKEGMV